MGYPFLCLAKKGFRPYGGDQGFPIALDLRVPATKILRGVYRA